ncbi:MAG: acyl-ACP--UDP-N-acetylglucosamine O-acyltransferase [Planctomycetes bacterium]|nr:acyl-ACP--UDP-N-acetylglucosamine O-acyltransferase [Planctomycetota bacterium]
MNSPPQETAIHPTAVVMPGATIGDDCEIGPYCVIEPSATVGNKCKIGPHVHILGHTTIGDDCVIRSGAVIGGEPQDDDYAGEATKVTIGDACQFHEHITIHRATGNGETIIGNNVRMMAGSHVGHNSRVDDFAVLVNNSAVGGHAHIGERVILSGQAAVHQFCKIGRLTMVAGSCMVTRDVPPFSIVTGAHPIRWRGTNKIGLRRNGIESDESNAIRMALRSLFAKDVNRETVADELATSNYDSIVEIAQFVRNSTRGLPTNK